MGGGGTVTPCACVYGISHRLLFRAIYEWNIVKGKISRLFQHPSKKGSFISFATNTTNTRLYAVDVHCVVYVWKLDCDAVVNVTPTSSRRHRRVPRATDAPAPIVPVFEAIQLDIENAAVVVPEIVRWRRWGVLDGELGECQFPDTIYTDHGLVLTSHGYGLMYHVDLASRQIKAITEFSTSFRQLDSRYILTIEYCRSKSEESGKTTYNDRYAVYDCMTGNKTEISRATLPELYALPAYACAFVYHRPTHQLLIQDGHTMVLCNPLMMAVKRVPNIFVVSVSCFLRRRD